VKLLAYSLLVVLFAASSAKSQRPRPPGLQQADQAAQQADKNLPPPTSQLARIDLAKLSQEADELARLAQTIPADVSSIQQGLLPKDTSGKLKQIEKLSKHLRSEITP
jgi:hypothetical protein